MPWLAVLAVCLSPCAQATTLGLRWDECASGGGAINKSFACSVALGDAVSIASLQVDAAVDSVVGMEWVVDVITAAPTLPDWWRMASGGCRPGALTASANFFGYGACADPWNGNGVALVQVFEPGQPRGGANQLRIICTTSVTAADRTRLDAGVPYDVGLLRLSYANSSGAGSCSGCTTAACLVFNSVLVLRDPTSAVTQLEYVPGSGSDPHRMTWQGTAADCQLVPVRNRTWGALKSLYRSESR
ncbi:MAG: hypothetical protein U0704_17135 [Candidatus Eisenbacteria bacterium]